ncbi:MAG: GAF domain-containing protein [Anaerolineae bacterium]|nr:GAF domain-containing protein [Anaerolineae bacterium]
MKKEQGKESPIPSSGPSRDNTSTLGAFSVAQEIRHWREQTEEISYWRERAVHTVLRMLVVLGGVIVVVAAYIEFSRGLSERVPVYLASYGALLVVTFWRRVSYGVQSLALLALFYGTGLMAFVNSGLIGSGNVFFLLFVVLASLLFGRWTGIGASLLVILTLLILGFAFFTGQLLVSTDVMLNTNVKMISWIITAVVFVLAGSLVVYFQTKLLRYVSEMVGSSRRLTQALEASQSSLERRVEERTHDLERRARYLQATTEVARDATMLTEDLQALFQRVVMLVSEQFGFYHAGIFLLDSTGEWAELQAASSEGGQRMLARNHRLRVGAQGTVGFVTAQGEARIALDVGEDAVFFDNPDLPDTRSALTLPLRIRDEVIGALDVQSAMASAFTQEDADVLQALADQVAVAISNARLFQQVQASVEAERRARGELSRQAWLELLRAQPELGFLGDTDGVMPVSAAEWDEESRMALTTGTSVKGAAVPGGEGGALAIPIRSRGQVVGVIDAHLPEDEGAWTPEQESLLEALSQQMSTALESAQLYRETQRRAAREQWTREITEEMRRSVDMEEILRTAVSSLGQALGAPRTYIRLTLGEESTESVGVADSEVVGSEVTGSEVADSESGRNKNYG